MSATATPAATAEGFERIRVRPAGSALGAVIEGVDLCRVDAETAAEIRRAFNAYSVVVFPRQNVDPESQIAFTRRFGEVHQHPLYRSKTLDGYPEILVLEHAKGQFFNGRNDVWHTDITFAEVPPLGSVLHCRETVTGFGDTQFCSMSAAYEGLSPALRTLLDGLDAEHSSVRMIERNNAKDYNVPITEVPDPVVHPVISVHPETGRRSLYVNPIYTIRFCDMTIEESQPLLDYLYAQAIRPENVYRHRWHVGDVVMFDNRCLMHYVCVDYGPDMHRLMHRTTATGTRPVGPCGVSV